MAQKKLPKLPFGQGSFSYYGKGNKIIYKKRAILSNGLKKDLSVTGDTPNECMKKMEILIRETENEFNVIRTGASVGEAMQTWVDSVKKPELKAQSYTRLRSTVRQIAEDPIADYPYQIIKPEQIQAYITKLNDEKYAYSTIKKCYEAFNAFYKYASAHDNFKNPMLLVTMIKAPNVKAETKEIEFFEQDDIDRFVEKCQELWESGSPRYSFGCALGANIYLGMRIGELLALTWKDVDFENNTIYICKTTIVIDNPEYDENDPDRMKEQKIPKSLVVIQKSTKKSRNRYVPINTKARKLLLLHKERSKFTAPDDNVICSRNKQLKRIKDISNAIESIERDAETDVQAPGTHVLRHTCASLYFRAGVPIETICQILGNTREVCEKTYIHFIEEQLKDAAKRIDIIDI